MSDSDGDIDDELLELAGATEKKRKRQASSSKQTGNKKRKARYVLSLNSLYRLLHINLLALPTATRKMLRRVKRGRWPTPFRWKANMRTMQIGNGEFYTRY